MSKCGKCGGFSFEIEEQAPMKSAFKLYFVQCSSCRTPIGVLEYNNSGALISKLEDRISNLEDKVSDIFSEIQQIGYDVKKIKSD